MPVQALWAKDKPGPLKACPHCGAALFNPFLRGQVARSSVYLSWRWPFVHTRSDIWALICWACKDIVGYEGIARPSTRERTGEGG